MKLSIAKRLAGGFSLVLVILVIMGWVSYRYTNYHIQSVAGVIHSEEIKVAEQAFLNDLKDAETSQRGYLLTGKISFLVPYDKAFLRARANLLQLGRLIASDPNSKAALDELQKLADLKRAEMQKTVALRRDRGLAEAEADVVDDSGKIAMDRFRVLLKGLNEEEGDSLRNPELFASQASRHALVAILFSTSLAFGVVLVAGAAIVRSITVPINRLVEGAAAIGSGALDYRLPVVARSHNELDTLAAAFNTMAQKLHNRDEQLSLQKEELEERNREIQRATKLKSEFLASMSHELRTPLNAILGFSELLSTGAAGPLASKQHRFVEHIHSGGAHLLKLINDVLDLSKIEAGKIDYSFEQFLLDGAIAEVLGDLAPLASARKIALEKVDDKNIRVLADRFRFKQVLYNLLSNALKFSPPGKKILIDTRVEGGFALVAVEDFGMGISPPDQAVVFEEFRQVGISANGVKEGTGLGLAITRRLVEQQGGTISLHSQLGKGSRFTFSVPLGSDPLQLEVPPASPARLPRELPLVLVIDDDAAARELLAGYLSGGGYLVELAAGAHQALPKASALLPDVITLDIMMPGNSGWDVLAKLRADTATASIPVIIISVADERSRGLSQGASEYLVKPVQKNALLDAVRKIVRKCSDGSCHALVVDDEYESRTLIAEYLQHADIVVTSVCSGKDALAVLCKQPVDFIVLDLMMPEMDGFEILRHLNAGPATLAIPVLVVTARDLTLDEERLLTRHTSALVHKGIDLRKNLLASVSRVVEAAPAPSPPMGASFMS